MPRYIVHPGGERELVEEPTASHPDGDAPRTAEGVVIGNDGLPMPPPAAPAPPAAAPEEPEPRDGLGAGDVTPSIPEA